MRSPFPFLLVCLLALHGAGLADVRVEKCNEAVKRVFDADVLGKPEVTIAAAKEALRLIAEAPEAASMVSNLTLQSQLVGIESKNHLAAGRLTVAQSLQHESWRFLSAAVAREVGKAWDPAKEIPRNLSKPTLSILLRTIRADVDLLEYEGRQVEGLEILRRTETQLRKSGQDDGHYRGRMLNDLSNTLKFLGYWRECKQVLELTIKTQRANRSVFHGALFDRAYWTSQVEGPTPELLADAKEAAMSEGVARNVADRRQLRRLMVKMAFGYREAGYEVGDLEDLIEEARQAGDQMEAIYARRELAFIQKEKGDFRTAEKNLIATLTGLRAMGRKSGEPAVYREYGSLLIDSDRPREGVEMVREAIRLTKGYRWKQHLPALLHLLALGQAGSGDEAGLRATLAELRALLVSGELEPEREMAAQLACAVCLQGMGDEGKAEKSRAEGLAVGVRHHFTEWQLDFLRDFPLQEIPVASKVARPSDPIAAKFVADLEPVRIVSSVLPNELARSRFTLSNFSSQAASGSIELNGEHLEAAWDQASGSASVRLLDTGGAEHLSQEIRLQPGEEFLIIADAKGVTAASLMVRWRPQEGHAQEGLWDIRQAEPDGMEVAVTNASLAAKNPFYALRLHHAFARRDGDEQRQTNLRVIASQAVRIEFLDVATGQLIACDANGDGELTGKGDLLIGDADGDGAANLSVPRGGVTEIALLVYPVTSSTVTGELTLDFQLQDGSGWQTAAKDILK